MNILRIEVAFIRNLFRSKPAYALLKRNNRLQAWACIAAGGMSNILLVSSRQTYCHSETVPDVAHITLPVRPSDNDSAAWKAVKRAVKWLADFITLLTRLGLLGLYFTPTVITAPVLLTNSETLEKGWWELLRYAIFASGPCLTKFAQWAATRPDIFNTKLCKELEFLQAQSYKHSWAATDRLLQEVYGKNWTTRLQLDKDFVTGSGLVAQVYHGYVLNEQQRPVREVAVKVLHPGVKAAMLADLSLLHYIATCTEDLAMLISWLWRGGASGDHDFINRESILETTISLSDSVEEFSALMQAQLDLQREGEAMVRFKKNFSGGKWADKVVFAEPVHLPGERSSSPYRQDVLVETFQRGQPMAEFLRKRDPSERSIRDRDLARLGLDIMLKMVSTAPTKHAYAHLTVCLSVCVSVCRYSKITSFMEICTLAISS